LSVAAAVARRTRLLPTRPRPISLLRAALLPAVLLLSACGTAPSPSPSTVPASGATVLLRMDACRKTCTDPRRIQYWSDGTVIRVDPASGACVVRRLAPAGLASLRARLARDADLLARELRADPVLAPGATQPPYTGDSTYTFWPPTQPGVFLRVSTVVLADLDRSLWRPTPEIERLSALGDALLDPEAVGGGAWLDPAWESYDPPIRLVYVIARPSAAPFTLPDIGALNAPLGRDLASFGVDAPSPLSAWQFTRCARLPLDRLAMLLDSLPASAFPAGALASPFIRVALGDATRSRELMLMIVRPLPDESRLACTDSALGYVW
jgi:hypothetical protein